MKVSGKEVASETPKQDICTCGRPILFACTDKCENCWAATQERWHGHDQSVKLKGTF